MPVPLNNDMSQRDELELQLKALIYFPKDACWDNTIKDLIDFIIQDRKRIVEPLIRDRQSSKQMNYEDAINMTIDAIDETLKRAGVE